MRCEMTGYFTCTSHYDREQKRCHVENGCNSSCEWHKPIDCFNCPIEDDCNDSILRGNCEKPLTVGYVLQQFKAMGANHFQLAVEFLKLTLNPKYRKIWLSPEWIALESLCETCEIFAHCGGPEKTQDDDREIITF